MSMTRSFLRSLVRKSYSSGLDIDDTVGRLKTALSKSWDSQVREFICRLITEELGGGIHRGHFDLKVGEPTHFQSFQLPH